MVYIVLISAFVLFLLIRILLFKDTKDTIVKKEQENKVGFCQWWNRK